MKIDIRTISVLSPAANRLDTCNVGVAQQREGRAREGAVAMIFETRDGRRVDVLLTPDEAQALAGVTMACAYLSAGAAPPVVELRDASAPAEPKEAQA